MNRYLITGGAGFIGSHLAERLWRAGHHVTVLDDLSSGSMQNLASLRYKPRFRMVEGCVMNAHCVNRAMSGCHRVFHLAATLGVEKVVSEVLTTLHTNLAGTENVLKAALRQRAGVVVASSSEVYGKGYRLPMREEDPLLFGPTDVARWGYAYSKAVDEVMTLRYHVEHNLPALAVRFFNVAGPRQDLRQAMVLPRFVEMALTGQPISLHGGGQATRCFCHVEDVVSALVALAECPQAAGKVVNIGSEEEITMRQLALLVKKVAGSGSKLVSVPTPAARGAQQSAIARRVPDLTRLRGLIGKWEPRGVHEIVESVVLNGRVQDHASTALDTAS